MARNEHPDFDEEFEETVAEWRERHRLQEDDAVMLLVDLFRMHQRHWDEIRRHEMPSFEQFRSDMGKLAETARTYQGQTAAVLEVLRKHPSGRIGITQCAAILACIASLLAGYLIGRVWP